ncbi:hypothetical protein [Trueperella bialowiezensis]|uniref:hypothetical protein n=1 Tax=Trueperella bialowiezensis TaxID=312285 RepID=UPI000F83B896|nr:hypothetical protein [Trueperella bialowiezensis]
MNTSALLPSWVARRETHFEQVRSRGVRFKDSGFSSRSDFKEHVFKRGLGFILPGYAGPGIAPDAPQWDREQLLTLMTVDYLERRRDDTHVHVPAPYAGHTAAHLLGLPTTSPHPPELVRQVPPGFWHNKTRNVKTYRAPTTPETVTICGIEVSSPPQTVIDLARLASTEDALACANFALHEGLATREEITSIYERMPRFIGANRVRDVLALMDSRVESVGESLTRLRIHQFGLPQVEPQVSFMSDKHVDRVDFLDRKNKIAYEFDGNIKLLDPRMLDDLDYRKSIANEGNRDRRLRQHGIHPFHLVWNDVKTERGFEDWLRQARINGFPL